MFGKISYSARFMLLSGVLLLGCAGVAYFGAWALIDYAALGAADQKFLEAVNQSSDLTTLFVAESRQNIHRINVFAEGVWALQSAVFAAIGLHGLCTMRR